MIQILWQPDSKKEYKGDKCETKEKTDTEDYIQNTKYGKPFACTECDRCFHIKAIILTT